MEEKDVNTSQTVPPNGEGGENDNQETAELKDVLAQALGRSFESNEKALEAVKNTFDYVGKVGKVQPLLEKLQTKMGGESNVIKFMEETINGSQQQQTQPEQPKVPSGDFISKEQYETDTFYSKNQKYEPFREIIGALQKANPGKAISDVVELDTFKAVFEKATKADDLEKSKSILHSNPRLGTVQDKISEAKTQLAQGNDAAAKASAVSAVIDAFGLRG